MEQYRIALESITTVKILWDKSSDLSYIWLRPWPDARAGWRPRYDIKDQQALARLLALRGEGHHRLFNMGGTR